MQVRWMNRMSVWIREQTMRHPRRMLAYWLVTILSNISLWAVLASLGYLSLVMYVLISISTTLVLMYLYVLGLQERLRQEGFFRRRGSQTSSGDLAVDGGSTRFQALKNNPSYRDYLKATVTSRNEQSSPESAVYDVEMPEAFIDWQLSYQTDAIASTAIAFLNTVCPENDKDKTLDEDGEMPLCTICLDVIEPHDRFRKIPCTHIHHSRCVTDWLLKTGKCPTCTQQIFS